MPKSSPIQTSFNAGKWGPRLQGRVDLEKYHSACNELENFIPTVQGPALKRSGTRFLKTVKNQAQKSRLIPFEFSTEQAYVLELYAGGMRVLKDSGAVLEGTVSITGVSDANPVVVTASNSYTNGDEVFITGSAQSQINGRFFTVVSEPIYWIRRHCFARLRDSERRTRQLPAMVGERAGRSVLRAECRRSVPRASEPPTPRDHEDIAHRMDVQRDGVCVARVSS